MATINKCLFPVAGYGTRFLPATKATPKEMLPIVTKPLIQYSVEEALAAGVTDMAFVTGRGKQVLEDHFDTSYELEDQIAGTDRELALQETRELIEQCHFSFTRQGQMKGLGHAILQGRSLIGDEAFAVMLVDDYCVADEGGDGVLSQMVKLYEQFQCSVVAIAEVPLADTCKYGVIESEQDRNQGDILRLSNMVEKPAPQDAPSNLAIIGRYILTPDIFDIIEQTAPGKNGEIQITDALLVQAKARAVIGYKFQGTRFDCGSVAGFVDATNFTYQRQVAKA